jgi:bile acid:Na+ symporter, BASS family
MHVDCPGSLLIRQIVLSWISESAERLLIPLQLVSAMLGMGATLTVRDFLGIAKNPGGLAIGLGLQLVFIPALAMLFIRGLSIPPGWAVGLILVSVVPGGAFSNLVTYLGRGDVPLSITLTATSTVGSIVTVPLLLGLLASAELPSDFVFPVGKVVRDILFFLLVPTLVGMVVLRIWPTRAPIVSRWAIRASVALLLLIVVGTLGAGRIKIAEYGWAPPARIVGFGIAAALVTPQLCRLLGRYDDETIALNTEVCIRNIGVALLMLQFFFPGRPEQGHVLYTCLFYSGMSGMLALPSVLRHRRGGSAVLLRSAHGR